MTSQVAGWPVNSPPFLESVSPSTGRKEQSLKWMTFAALGSLGVYFGVADAIVRQSLASRDNMA